MTCVANARSRVEGDHLAACHLVAGQLDVAADFVIDAYFNEYRLRECIVSPQQMRFLQPLTEFEWGHPIYVIEPHERLVIIDPSRRGPETEDDEIAFTTVDGHLFVARPDQIGFITANGSWDTDPNSDRLASGLVIGGALDTALSRTEPGGDAADVTSTSEPHAVLAYLPGTDHPEHVALLQLWPKVPLLDCRTQALVLPPPATIIG